ncbi:MULTISPECIES: hypothetical protein [unclassified Chitinophaga]|uniref:hypothetical protein n=1 Tax=unclassified Chitinophaga TaxID=2619133 RepID=UPI003010359C
MKKKLLCCFLFPLIISCKKDSAKTTSNLPEPDTAVIGNSYAIVTAASSIALDAGSVYRLGLAPYASFFKFDRSVKNGDLYFEAIGESAKQFRPLKFFILNNGTGKVVAIATPSEAELEKFNEEWQR